ncbi:MAG: DUF2889 domain-containing protein [Thiomonas sp.]|uniref:DUF2889 domain-containing protein n=1 Tax=Thiomonas sp. TaxID=2047785 RepID=UPI002A366A01|nr:DUF2889 domain-containing protein [Thiomonas sp.]MDY0330164.1 DUF2889 domain-containing protein [Thiomonas sp.]
MRDSPAASVSLQRRLVHRRSIDVEVYAREDGLWDLQAELRDVKTRDITLSERIRPAGVPVHDMLLIVTIDDVLDIVDARSHTLFSPYDTCGDHDDAYKRLIGLNLLRGFRAAVRERLGGVLGCTHLTELTQVLPTAAIQGMTGLTKVAMPVTEHSAGMKRPPDSLRSHSTSRLASHSDSHGMGQSAGTDPCPAHPPEGVSVPSERPCGTAMPFQLNRCHALRLDAPAVAKFYPRWAQPSAPQRAKGTMPTSQTEDETP